MFWAFEKSSENDEKIIYAYRYSSTGKQTGKIVFDKKTKTVIENTPAVNEDDQDVKRAIHLCLKLITQEGSPQKRTFAFG